MFDPAAFSPDAVAEETRLFNDNLEAMLSGLPAIYEVPPEVTRELRRKDHGLFGPVVISNIASDTTIPGPAGDIPLHVLLGDRVDGVFLHFHGGGWAFGDNDLQDPWLEAIALEVGVAVVSVGYRLAPEDPYPAGSDDCEAVALWLVENAAAEFGSDTLIIGGESAGAHFSVTTMLRMRDRHGYTGFAGANLVYGGYDLNGTPSVRTWGGRRLILDVPTLDWLRDQYLGDAHPDLHDPDVSPLYGDLTALPPALFTVGTLDPLLDDSIFMAARWAAAGHRAELNVVPGGVHAFDAFPITIAREARDRMHTFLSGLVDPNARADEFV